MKVWLLLIIIGLAHTDEQDLTVSPPVEYKTAQACYLAAKPIVLNIEKRMKELEVKRGWDREFKVIRFHCKPKTFI